MKRLPVVSSSVASLGYDAAARTFEVEFTNGAVSQYFDVPLAVYDAFATAESKGRFLNDAIRDSYTCVSRLAPRSKKSEPEAARPGERFRSSDRQLERRCSVGTEPGAECTNGPGSHEGWSFCRAGRKQFFCRR